MRMPERKISFRKYYRVKEGKIILGKSSYSCDALMAVSIILRLLSLFAVVFGVLSCLRLGNYSGIVLSVFGALILLWGYLYKSIVLEAAAEQNLSLTGIRRIIYRL